MTKGSMGSSPTKTARRRCGDAAESAAQAVLVRAGLVPVAANVNFRCGELDLVMRDGATLVFVEVRYRRDARYGGGAASVDARKRARIARAAGVYLSRWRGGPQPACRFDVVEAEGDPAAPRVNWIRDAFRLDGLC